MLIINSGTQSPIPEDIGLIIKSLHKSKKVLLVTGAGISVAGGIPDFRSFDGLYNVVKDKYPKQLLKGKDIFDGNVFNDEKLTEIYYSFMAELKETVDKASVTCCHRFISQLSKNGQLLRCYTQNIDFLEERVGLYADFNNILSPIVQLHGSLSHIRCTICSYRNIFEEEFISVFKNGSAPNCPQCISKSIMRMEKGLRNISTGILRPDIVLYNQHHPSGDIISSISSADIKKGPDMLIVIGTSLKVVGIKSLVKDLAKAVKKSNPNNFVVLVNKTPIKTKEWENIFDVCWVGGT